MRSSPIKRKARKKHTVVEDRHLQALVSLGCLPCLMDGHEDTPAGIHHSRRRPDGQNYGRGLRSSHFEGIPMCEGHHQGLIDTTKVSIHGNPLKFRARYGSELDLLGIVRSRLKDDGIASWQLVPVWEVAS